MGDFIMLARSFFEHDLWNEKRAFSRAEAWIDLIRTAAFRSHQRMIGNELVTVPRGAQVVSERFLSKRWGWSTKRIRSFLDVLKKGSMVEAQKKQYGTLLTLCNFARYNTPGSAKEAPLDTKGKREGSAKEARRKREGSEREEGKEGEDGTAVPAEQGLLIAEPPPEVPKSDVRHKKLTAYYCKAYEQTTGIKYPFNGKDGKSLSEFLKKTDTPGEEIARILDFALDNPDDFDCKHASSLLGFLSRFSNIAALATR